LLRNREWKNNILIKVANFYTISNVPNFVKYGLHGNQPTVSSFTFILKRNWRVRKLYYIRNMPSFAQNPKVLQNVFLICIKATFINSDISLINWVSYRPYILFWCPVNQNKFYFHKNGQHHCGEIVSTISVCMRNSALGSSVHQY
jgi:hypothetical protein